MAPYQYCFQPSWLHAPLWLSLARGLASLGVCDMLRSLRSLSISHTPSGAVLGCSRFALLSARTPAHPPVAPCPFAPETARASLLFVRPLPRPPPPWGALPPVSPPPVLRAPYIYTLQSLRAPYIYTLLTKGGSLQW